MHRQQTLPILSDLEKGWYGMPTKLAGIAVGPHPVGFSGTAGNVNDIALLKHEFIIMLGIT
jgi:hypothetical protein